MRINKAKAKLAADRLALGATIKFPSPDLVELCGAVGFDFVSLDVEHEVMNYEQVVHMIRAAESFGVTPVIRLPKDADLILRFLGAGAQGIHVPNCNSVEDVRELVEWTRFYPEGKRTFYALGRSANYAMGIDDEEWSRSANRELMVVAQVEQVEGIDNLDAMLAVPGVDAFQIGPKDLWQSMGMPDPKVVDQVIADVTTRIIAAGRQVSLRLRIGKDVHEKLQGHVQRGVRMISVDPLDFVRNATPEFIERLRSIV